VPKSSSVVTYFFAEHEGRKLHPAGVSKSDGFGDVATDIWADNPSISDGRFTEESRLASGHGVARGPKANFPALAPSKRRPRYLGHDRSGEKEDRRERWGFWAKGKLNHRQPMR
jgi:hypothetical protein